MILLHSPIIARLLSIRHQIALPSYCTPVPRLLIWAICIGLRMRLLVWILNRALVLDILLGLCLLDADVVEHFMVPWYFFGFEVRVGLQLCGGALGVHLVAEAALALEMLQTSNIIVDELLLV